MELHWCKLLAGEIVTPEGGDDYGFGFNGYGDGGSV